MRGSVLLVIASLGLATVGSTLLWLVRRITWRRPAPFMKQLEAVSPARGRPVGPAGGISKLDPLTPQPEGGPPSGSARGGLGALSPAPRPCNRPGHGKYSGVRPRAGRGAERAVGGGDQYQHQPTAGRGPQGTADAGAHARLHRRPATAAQGRYHRLRGNSRHDPHPAPAGGGQPHKPGPRGGVRTLCHHPGGAPGCDGGRPEGGRHRGAVDRPASRGRDRSGTADRRAGRVDGGGHRRRHHRDRAVEPGRRGGSGGGEGWLVRH